MSFLRNPIYRAIPVVGGLVGLGAFIWSQIDIKKQPKIDKTSEPIDQLEQLRNEASEEITRISKKIKIYQSLFERGMVQNISRMFRPFQDYLDWNDIRSRVEKGEEKEFGGEIINDEPSKKFALWQIDQKIKIHEEEIKDNPVKCSDWGETLLAKVQVNFQKGLLKIKQDEVAQLNSQLKIKPSEFDEEEIGPFEDIIPDGEIPVFVRDLYCFDWSGCADKGELLANKKSHGFSHEKHLPAIKEDLKWGGAGCSLCHSDSIGTLLPPFKERVLVNLTGEKTNVILLNGRYSEHDPTCKNCHGGHGTCSSCHRTPFSKEIYELTKVEGKTFLRLRP